MAIQFPPHDRWIFRMNGWSCEKLFAKGMLSYEELLTTLVDAEVDADVVTPSPYYGLIIFFLPGMLKRIGSQECRQNWLPRHFYLLVGRISH